MQQERNKEKKAKEKLDQLSANLELYKAAFADQLSKVGFSHQDHKEVITEISNVIILNTSTTEKKFSMSSLNDITSLDEIVGNGNKEVLSDDAKKFLLRLNTHFGLLKMYQQDKVPSLTMTDILNMKAEDGHPSMQQLEITAKDYTSRFFSDLRKVINTMVSSTKATEDANLFHMGKCHD